MKSREAESLRAEDLKADSPKASAKKSRNVLGIIFLTLQFAASVAFGLILARLNVLSNTFLAAILIILALLFLFTLVTQFFRSGRVVGKVFSILISIVLVIGSLFLYKTSATLDKVSSGSAITVQETHMAFLVMKDSSATGQQDLNGRSIGILTSQDRDLSVQSVDDLNAKLTTAAIPVTYDSTQTLITALYDGSVDCIVLNEALRPLIVENLKPNFNEETRVLDTFKIEQTITKAPAPQEDSKTEEVKADQGSFNVYLSGNDAYGEVSLDSGRSDVNIIATINPTTHTILLTTTPRDFYVPLVFSPTEGGTDAYRDKLTHAGVYGMRCSMYTLENVYGITLDYYARVNFTGFKDIINALGGIDVNSQYAFSTGKYSYSEGINHLDGDQALAFARERHAFNDGDFQRGRNQMEVIKAMADKIMSPAILPNFMTLMDQLSYCFLTDVPRDTITDLVKAQLSDNQSWTILTNEVGGTTGSGYSYAMGTDLSMVFPDATSVEDAKNKIQQVLNGQR